MYQSFIIIVISIMILVSVAQIELNLPVGTNTVALLESQDYPTETHEVTTKDGYILSMYRIPKPGAPIMFLQHGLLMSSDSFVIMGPGHSLGQDLWDADFDVWLGNARGNQYSRRHVTLNPDNNDKYWDFSWHEMGMYDVPASLLYVMNTTQYTNVNFVCYSMGCNMILALLSEKPKWNTVIRKIHAVAPANFLTYNTFSSPVLAPAFKSQLEILQSTGFIRKEISPSTLNLFIKPICDVLNIYCNIFYSILYGPNPASEYQRELIKEVLPRVLMSTSLKTILHLQQLVNKETFAMYDYGTQLNLLKYGTYGPPEYQLKNVDVPVYLYGGETDNLVQKQNIIHLGHRLGDNTQEMIWIDALQNNHFGLLFEGDLGVEIIKRT